MLNRCQLWYVRHIKKKANKACSSLFSDSCNSTSLEAILDMERIILHVFIQKYCNFFCFFLHVHTRWRRRIRTNDLRSMRYDPQLIELFLRTKILYLIAKETVSSIFMTLNESHTTFTFKNNNKKAEALLLNFIYFIVKMTRGRL
jgi:hypothetical protein